MRTKLNRKGRVSLPQGMRGQLALITASLVLALAFTLSCSSGDDGSNNGGGSFNENSQIVDGYGTPLTINGVIKLRLRGNDGNDIYVNAGSVANGVANLQLPSTVSEEYVSRTSLEGCEVPSGAKVMVANIYLYDNDGLRIGSFNANYFEGKAEAGDLLKKS
ncbi:MAG: hypothetical protein LBH25_02985 [Fibromonadaceae bacterium]|jgi:hypothetical protein|nr:hypothetical protein [Fibromonadaceae bacterium]